MRANKKTLKNPIELNGAGIHSGKNVKLHIEPSQSGIITFHRTDIPGFAIPAQADLVETRRNTAIFWKGNPIFTIEHLMAAFFMTEIDSADVYVNGPEIPSVDGSAAPYVKLLQESGVAELDQSRVIFDILQPFLLRDGRGSISGSPAAEFRLSYEIEFSHPLIGRQEATVDGEPSTWMDEIASARTFGFLKEVQSMRKQNLARGGSLENALILDDKGVINGPLRFKDEFVRHKLLDLMGDLFLIGGYLRGHIRAEKAGHNLHLQTVHYLMDHPEIMKRRKG